ncbi:hypothetical protein F503_04268 [Ophiostoma piceae UAMH 11346]|uniref:Ubiquitin-conjugating enzyme n=1 Tax=Ophiostoma piceae (strain UAMH 11346) TaxID=1262450 RepID=S3C9S1_OPHP1|nr:hypothetical protein F503_04268 [Ophiostoma piceae UAMH 11346]
MESGDQQPGPLRLGKSALDIGNATSDAFTGTSLQAHAAEQVRKASVATDESNGSVRGDPGVSQRRLAIPKKRQPLPTWHDDGTGRFYSPSASYSATMIRRNQNITDNTGHRSDSNDLGFQDSNGIRQMSMHNEFGTGERYSSIGAQYVQDMRHRQGNGQQQNILAQSQHGRQHHLDEDVAEHLRRISIRPDDPFYSARDEIPNPMQATHAGPNSQYWGSGFPPDYGRQASMSASGADRCDLYGPGPGPGAEPVFSRTYDRPLSMDPLSAMPNMANMFPREPIERAATAAPFESRVQQQARMQQGHFGSPQRHMHYRDYLDQRASSRLSHFRGKPDTDIIGPDPQILVPMISVTPECRAVEGKVNSFWVAIELSGTITQPLDNRVFHSRDSALDYCQPSMSGFSAEEDQELYRFGYISNLDIKILPSYQAEILEVLGKSPSLLTLLPGSRCLIMVHVHLDTTKGSYRHDTQEYRPPSQKNRSEQLLEDLELQLGATSQEYMQIQLKYSHSGFPKHDARQSSMGRVGGCIEGPSAAKEMAKRISASMDIRMLRRSEPPLARWGGQQPRREDGTPEDTIQDDSLDEITPRAKSQNQRKDKNQQKEPQAGTEVSPLQERPKVPLRRMRKLSRPASSTLDRLASATFLPRKRVSLPQIPRLALSSTNIPLDTKQMSPGCLLPRSKGVRMGPDGPRQPIPETAPQNIRRPAAMDALKLQNYMHETSQQSIGGENYGGQAAYGEFRSSSRSSTMSFIPMLG